jgi:hypothetical protein
MPTASPRPHPRSVCAATPPLIFGFEPQICGSLRACGLSTGRPRLAGDCVRQLVDRVEVEVTDERVRGARIGHAAATSSYSHRVVDDHGFQERRLAGEEQLPAGFGGGYRGGGHQGGDLAHRGGTDRLLVQVLVRHTGAATWQVHQAYSAS